MSPFKKPLTRSGWRLLATVLLSYAGIIASHIVIEAVAEGRLHVAWKYPILGGLFFLALNVMYQGWQISKELKRARELLKNFS